MATQKIETGLIADSAVTTAKLADNSVTAAKIAAGSLDDQVKGISSSADAVAITIDSSENVGIGTTLPTFASGSGLEIERAGIATLRLQDTTNVANVELQSGESGLHVRVGANGSSGDLFNVSSAGTSRLLINSSGNVGIGTSSPDTLLHLNAVQAGPVLRLSRQDGSVLANDSYGKIEFYTTDVTNTGVAGYIDVQAESGSAYSSMIFGTGLAGSADEKVRISSNGNVGIGTDNPAQPLHVDLNGTSTSKKYLQLDGNGSSGSVSGQTGIGFRPIGAGSNVHASIEGLEDGNGTYKTALSFNINNSNSDTTPVEAMRIDSSGNVAIGSTSDALENMSGLFRALNSSGGDRTVAHFGAHNYGDTGKTFINIGTEYGDGTSRIGSFNDTGNSSVLVFDTHSATSGQFTERMRISSNGSIGVGTNESTYSMSIQNIVSSDVKLQIKNTTNNEDTGIFIDAVRGGAATNSRIGHSVIAGNNLLQITNPNGHAFYTGTSSLTERMRILSSGGITFNGDTAAANALDDYEEGTWSPSIGTGTASFTHATYTKVGRLVTCHLVVTTFSERTSGNAVTIGSLPFTAESSDRPVTMGALSAYISSNFGSISGGYLDTTSSIRIYNTSVSTFRFLKHSDLTSGGGSAMYIAFSYMAS